MSTTSSTDAAIAAHRFGLGEATLARIEPDPQGWLLAQIGPADPAKGEGLLSTPKALALTAAEREQRRKAKVGNVDIVQTLVQHYRETAIADARSRLVTAATTTRPFMERMQLFWANHFTVSLAKGSTRGLVGAFERDAIRPHIAGRFEDLLVASTTHPAMLRYLDNTQSAGPHSRVVALASRRAERAGETPRITGINENLAREVLELHTLGAESARASTLPANGKASYTQADVTAFAAVLSGWRVGLNEDDSAGLFNADWHEPGAKTVLGKRYPEGPDALKMVLHDLARHPATARFVSTKLARHLVADEPPPALVDRLTATYLRTDGQLSEVYRELVASPEAWSPHAAKLKTPEEFVLSGVRVFSIGERDAIGVGQAIVGLGQKIQSAPSPAGWSDRADDWLGPDAVWKRVEWSTRMADRIGPRTDARAIANQSFGGWLGDRTRLQLERAADGSQAVALLMMAPEFQRR